MDVIAHYLSRASAVIASLDPHAVGRLADAIASVWLAGRRVFVCGNGGSAANAEHFVNDLVFGVSPKTGDGIRATALSANAAVVTCLANDIGYDQIYAYQLTVQAEPGDLLVVLSGSGNSPNIIAALEQARAGGIQSAAILGYSGGQAKALAEIVVHVAVEDMQISEDCMQVVAHAVSRKLAMRRAGLATRAAS